MGASGTRQRARSGSSIPRTIPPQARASPIKLRGSSAIGGGILSRHRSRRSVWVWLFDFVVDAGSSLQISRSWEECRHFDIDVSISERVLSPRSGCLDLGKSVGSSLQMSRSRNEYRHLAPDVSILERVSVLGPGCISEGCMSCAVMNK